MRLLRAGLLAVAVATTAGRAAADIQYEFASAATPNSVATSFTVPLGGTLDVLLYVTDTSTNMANPNGGAAFAAASGLGTAAVWVSYGDGSKVAVTAVAPATPPGGGGTGVANSNNTSSAYSDIAADPGGASGIQANANGRVLVGTFTFSGIADTAGSPVTVSASDIDPSTSNNVQGFDPPFSDYDQFLTGTYTAQFTVSPVPEPTLLVAVAGVGLAAWRVRRIA